MVGWRRLLVTTLSVAAAGIAAVSADPSGVSAASPTATPSECPAVSAAGMVDLRDLIAMRTLGGALTERYAGGYGLNERALACFGSRRFTTIAFAAGPEGLGGVVGYYVDPQWLDTWESPAAWVAATDDEAAPGALAGPFLALAVPPSLEATWRRRAGRWIELTVHLDDRAALTCRTREGYPGLQPIPTAADVVKMCRTSLVVDAVRSALPPTDTVDRRDAPSPAAWVAVTAAAISVGLALSRRARWAR